MDFMDNRGNYLAKERRMSENETKFLLFFEVFRKGNSKVLGFSFEDLMGFRKYLNRTDETCSSFLSKVKLEETLSSG